MPVYARILGSALLVFLWPTIVSAQVESEVIASMAQIAADLGVRCEFCHVRASAERMDYKSDANPKKAIARKMMAMTREINERVWDATGSANASAGAVRCGTCHHGTPVPLPIATIVTQTISGQGVPAGLAKYRALRTEYYERGGYDFTEAELLRIAEDYLLRSDPDTAIALARMNLEFRPASAPTYVVLGYAYTRKLDDAAAIPLFEKALELDPKNHLAEGYLYQLRTQKQRRQ